MLLVNQILTGEEAMVEDPVRRDLYFVHLKCIAYSLCVVFNVILIHALRKRHKLKMLSYRLVVGLSLSDVFVGIFGLSRTFLRYSGHESEEAQFLDVQFTLYASENFFVNFSIVFLLIIAIDRYIHIKYPLMYRFYMTPKRATCLVIVNAAFTAHMTISTNVLPMYANPFLVENLEAYRIYRVVLSLVYILLILLVCILYISTYLSIRQRVGSAISLQPMPTGQEQCLASQPTSNWRPRNRRQSPDHEFAKAMAIIMLTLMICLVPNLSLAVYNRVTMLSKGHPARKLYAFSVAREWSYLAMLLNSSLNAVIIILCSKQLQAYIKSVLCS